MRPLVRNCCDDKRFLLWIGPERIRLSALILIASAIGCGSSQSSSPAPSAVKSASGASVAEAGAASEHRGAQSWDDYRRFQARPLAKFAGRVLVDGKGPRKDCKLFVILTDPKHLDENVKGLPPKFFTVCHADGTFGFSTNEKHDGVLPGKYIVTFVELHERRIRRGNAGLKTKSTGGSTGDRVSFVEPDELKNLYSDPDKNAANPKYSLDLQPPGRDDYSFDLNVSGQTPLAKAAPHAVKKMSPKFLEWPP